MFTITVQVEGSDHAKTPDTCCHDTATEVHRPTGEARRDSRILNNLHGLSEWTCSRFLLLIIDNVISGLVIGPLTVFYWRGTWTLLERHWLPELTFDKDGNVEQVAASLSNGWICAAVGNVGLVLVVYAQHGLSRRLNASRAVDWLFGYHLYTYILAFFNVCHWRGVWILLNSYTGVGATSAWTTYAIGQVLLWIFCSSRNAVAPPLLVAVDVQPNLFIYPTRFNAKTVQSANTPKTNSNKHLIYALDVVFTVGVVHQLVVFYWRGAWTVLDYYLFPDDKQLSAIVSLAAAYTLQAVLCLVQPVANAIYCRPAQPSSVVGFCRPMYSANAMGAFRRWILETVVYFFGNFVGVLHWRGVWYLLDIYVLPDQPDASAAVTHVVGIVGLWLICAGHSVTMVGCLLDGGSENDRGCILPSLYVRFFIDRYRKCKRTGTDNVIEIPEMSEKL